MSSIKRSNELKYILHSKTKRFKNLVKLTVEEIISISQNHQNISLSFSGGKDSSVMYYLFYIASKYEKIKFIPIIFDCNAIWEDTHVQINNMDKLTGFQTTYIKSDTTYQTLRLSEYSTGTFKQFTDLYTIEKIVFDNAKKAVKLYNIDLQCIATRRDESKNRAKFFKYHNHYRFAKNSGVQSYYPLKNWKLIDIWAFIFAYNLPVNNLYYKFDSIYQIGIDEYRVDEYLEREAIENGSLRVLQKFYPQIYQREVEYNSYLSDFL